MNTTALPPLSLEQFMELIEREENWTDQIPGIFTRMPSMDDAVVEMAYMPPEQRDEMRQCLGEFMNDLSHYIAQMRETMSEKGVEITQAQKGNRAMHAYHDSSRLSKNPFEMQPTKEGAKPC